MLLQSRLFMSGQKVESAESINRPDSQSILGPQGDTLFVQSPTLFDGNSAQRVDGMKRAIHFLEAHQGNCSARRPRAHCLSARVDRPCPSSDFGFSGLRYETAAFTARDL